ncbi:MAG: hypothetical protein Q7P63_13420 [Verrucomicrobiota bacterium JB022]|nr:hypothetical protein [Verrucomicrobiota bacterium JB022]
MLSLSPLAIRIKVQRAYNAICGQVNPLIELPSWEIAAPELEAAHAHRERWRPNKVKVLLLAESHVATTPQEAAHDLNYEQYAQLAPLALPHAFVRLVYCLGYGERTLAPGVSKNPGTWQFWKIFYACVNQVIDNTDFAPILISGQANPAQRLANKIAVLEQMRERGIWLLDASLPAIYKPRAPRPIPQQVEAILEASWQHWTQAQVAAAQPCKVIIIGRGVSTVVAPYLYQFQIPHQVLRQPNSYRNHGGIPLNYWQSFFEFCQA